MVSRNRSSLNCQFRNKNLTSRVILCVYSLVYRCVEPMWLLVMVFQSDQQRWFLETETVLNWQFRNNLACYPLRLPCKAILLVNHPNPWWSLASVRFRGGLFLFLFVYVSLLFKINSRGSRRRRENVHQRKCSGEERNGHFLTKNVKKWPLRIKNKVVTNLTCGQVTNQE